MTAARLTRVHQLMKTGVFPYVRNLGFSDLAPVYRGAPQRLAARLPRLEKYDYRYRAMTASVPFRRMPSEEPDKLNEYHDVLTDWPSISGI